MLSNYGLRAQNSNHIATGSRLARLHVPNTWHGKIGTHFPAPFHYRFHVHSQVEHRKHSKGFPQKQRLKMRHAKWQWCMRVTNIEGADASLSLEITSNTWDWIEEFTLKGVQILGGSAPTLEVIWASHQDVTATGTGVGECQDCLTARVDWQLWDMGSCNSLAAADKQQATVPSVHVHWQ